MRSGGRALVCSAVRKRQGRADWLRAGGDSRRRSMVKVERKKRAEMLSSKQRSFWVPRTLSAVTMLSACNLILDNDPRSLGRGAGGEWGGGGSTSSGRGGIEAESGSPSHERGGEA